MSGLVEVRERFLSEHLRRWVGAYSVAVESVAVEELSGMVGLLVELVGGSQPLPSVAEDLLGDPKTGLKQISRYLTVPSRCGLWLSVPAIQRVAVRAELACGFGPRAKMFESLWCSAVDHQRIQPLVEAFLIALEPWRKVGGPGWQQTRRLLEQIAQQDAIGGAHGSDS